MQRDTRDLSEYREKDRSGVSPSHPLEMEVRLLRQKVEILEDQIHNEVAARKRIETTIATSSRTIIGAAFLTMAGVIGYLLDKLLSWKH